jgi:hypothetical protein
MIKWVLALSVGMGSFLRADNEAILGAISTFNVRQLERELQRQGALKRNIKKEIIKVLDSLIAQETENNVWYKKYDALAQIGISIPLLILSANYFYSLPKIQESSFSENVMAFFAGKALVTKIRIPETEKEGQVPATKGDSAPPESPSTSPAKTAETPKAETPAQTKKIVIERPNTVLASTAGFFGGIGLFCLLQGLLKLGRYTPRYICALAMKTLVLATPDAKSMMLTSEEKTSHL